MKNKSSWIIRSKLLEPLLLLIGRFLHDLCARLDAQSLAAAALQITFNGTERWLRLPVSHARHEISAEADPARSRSASTQASRSTKIKLAIVPAEPRRVQHGLFIPSAPEPEKLELTLGKIRALVGAENVKTPELRNTLSAGVVDLGCAAGVPLFSSGAAGSRGD